MVIQEGRGKKGGRQMIGRGEKAEMGRGIELDRNKNKQDRNSLQGGGVQLKL